MNKNMSLLEILVIVIVGFCVVKPDDFPVIIKKIKELRSFITNTKKDIMSHIDPGNELRESVLDNSLNSGEDIEQINFYLEKISQLGAEYEGEYSLTSIRNHYRKVSLDTMKQVQKNKS